MKAVVAAFNQEKALVGAFSVITNLRMDLFEALLPTVSSVYLEMLSEAVIEGCSAHTRPKVACGQPIDL